MGILFAFVSMAFAGLNDFVFKEFSSRYGRLQGTFLSGIGLVWAAVFGLLVLLTSGGISGTGWYISVGAGVVSFLSNILFVRSYRALPAGTGATIYRLNLVVVALLGFLVLGEPVTVWKVAGLTMGTVAVLVLGVSESRGASARTAPRSVAALVVACLLRAAMGILYKVSTSYGVPYYELLMINGIAWAVGGFIWARATREVAGLNKVVSAFSLVSGLLVCGITYFMLAATALADASIVIPITQMSFVVTCVLGAVRLREPFTTPKLVAIAAAVGCVVCLSLG